MKVLFTGLGSIGRKHLRSLFRVRDKAPEILAYRTQKGNCEVRNTDSDLMETVREYHSLEEALDQDPDVAFITNPTHCHLDTALAVARAGVSFMVEKPLSDSLSGLGQLLSLVEQRDITTLMGCQLRFHPILQKVRSLLQDKNNRDGLHSFRVVCGSYLPEWRPDQDYRESYSARAEQGGGVVLDLIHELDYLHWWFGSPDEVQSYTGQISHLEIESEDVAEAIVRYGDDLVGNIHLDYFRPEPERSFELVGDDWLLRGDLISNTLERTVNGKSERTEFDLRDGELYDRQLAYFLDTVEEGGTCDNNVRTGRQVLETALRIKEMSR